MRNMKYNITFGIALVCAMLFTACDNIADTADIFKPVEKGYGRININLNGGDTARKFTRTVLPSTAFDRYEYTFTKVGETTGDNIDPDSEGFFTLRVGDYTVAVKAYIGNYTLVATGESEQFSVNHSDNDTVEVSLSNVDNAGVGKLSYTVTYPENATTEITLQKYPGMDDITLSPSDTEQGNGKTQTLELEAGSYLLTVYVGKPDSYAGLIEIVRIYPTITTKYVKDFNDYNFLAINVPTVGDYNIKGTSIDGTGVFTYDGDEKIASITRKENASQGEITVFYDGIDTQPVNAGEYNVTFRVAAAPAFLAATGLFAGTITINKAEGLIARPSSGVNSKTHNSITINAVSASPNGQSIEYGISETNNANAAVWQTDLTFDGLTASKTYYIFTRTVESRNYKTGQPSAALITSTNDAGNVSKIEYYWVDEHGSLATTSGGATTVAAGAILTITAQGEGYTVKQWYVDGINTGQSGNTYNFSSTTSGKHTVGLFVEKDDKTYNTNIVITVNYLTVTYNINGGTGTTPAAAQNITSTTLPSSTGFSRTGYTFGGWNTSSTGTGTNYNGGVSYTPTSNITLYAKWTCTVTFNGNSPTGGTAPAVVTVNAGSSIILPTAGSLYKTGYTLVAWNTSSSGTGGTTTDYPVNSFYTPTGNITLYARWSNSLDVTFNINNGTGTTPPKQTVVGGSGVTTTLPSASGFSRDGYTFHSWNTRADGTGDSYNPGDTYTLTGDVTLYARWNITITFDFNGGTGGGTSTSVTAPCGSRITGPSTGTFSRTGYTFNYWSLNVGGLTVGDPYLVPNTNTTLYAIWLTNVNVTFNINGGTGTAPPQQGAPNGYSITLPDGSGLSRSGYTFGGWSTNTGGTGTIYTSSYTITGISAVTLYAKWYQNRTVTFDINGGTGTTPPQQVTGVLTVPDGSGFSREGYTFFGWTTINSGGGDFYGINSTYLPSSDVTLYAVWATELTENIFANCSMPLYGSQWFKFRATATTQYIHALFGGLTSFYVQLYNSDGSNLESSTSLSSSTKSTSRTLIVNQEYYIRVTPNSTYSGTYQIGFNSSSTTLPTFSLPNVTQLTVNVWADGNISTNGGEQWFKFTATASPQYIHFNMVILGGGNMQLYDSGGTVVGSNETISSYLSRTVTPGNEYYIKVKAGSAYSGFYRIGFTASTTAPATITLPNNANVTQLTEGVWANGSVSANGEQWFKFTATATTQYIHFNPGTVTRLTFQLYNNIGAAVVNSTTINNFDNPTMSKPIGGLSIGDEYYIKASNGVYQIAFNKSTTAPALTLPNANVIQITEGVWANGNIPTSSDEQWFTFTATATTQYIHFNRVNNDMSGANLRLYDTNGLTTSSFNISSGDINSTFTVTINNVYYIRVMPNTSVIGSYQITFNKSSTTPAITIPTANAITLTANTWYVDVITPKDGEQWFKFTATVTGNQYIHFIRGTSLSYLSYARVQLYDSNGVKIGDSSLLNGMNNPDYTFQSVTSGNVYYIRLTAISFNDYGGQYRIAFNTSTTSPTVTW